MRAGTLNLRKSSILMLAVAAIVAMSSGAAKAQWSVPIGFHNSSNAVVHDVRVMPSWEPNRLTTPNLLAGYRPIVPGEYFSTVISYPVGVTPCLFYTIVFDNNIIHNVTGARQTEADLCAPALNPYPGFSIGAWTIVYLGS
jgi:hypothetical protein